MFSFVFSSSPVYSHSFNKLEPNLPDWFFNPSPGDDLGVIGIASQTGVAQAKTLEFARFQAGIGLRSIKPGLLKQTSLFDLILGLADRVSLPNGQVSFSNKFQDETTAMVRLVYTKGNADRPEAERKCDFAKCRPAWLCSPVRDGLSGVLGVSYQASSLRRQLELTGGNAMKLLEYSLGVKVVGRQSLSNFSSSTFKARFSSEQYQVKKRGRIGNELIFFTKAQCLMNETLISWIVGPDLPEYTAAKDLGWLENPFHQGIPGAVGHTSRNNQPFFSRSLEIAYEKAFNELSKNESLRIHTETDVSRKRRAKYAEKVRIKHENVIRPRILGIYLDEEQNLSVWAAQEKHLSEIRNGKSGKE